MATIAEIIAAKKAAAAASQPKSEVKTETMRERVELDALDARLAPVKPAVATAARKGAGLILNRDMPPSNPNGEPRGQATPVKGPEELSPRSLGSSDGESIDVTPLTADPVIKDWHKAVNAFATDLVVMRDPIDPERCWLAVRLDEEPLHPLLLKDLPLYEHPMVQRQPDQPF